MPETVGIKSFGGYVPWLRLERSAVASAHAWYNPSLRELGNGQRAILAWDEDVITLAVEAGRSCIDNGGSRELGGLVLASTSAPFADRQNAVIVKEALRLSDDIATSDVSGSRRAGTSALLMALRAARADGTDQLCVAAENPRTQPASEAELTAGSGAAGVHVGHESLKAVYLGGGSTSIDFVDRFRSNTGEFDYVWESRWARDEGHGKIVADAVGMVLKKQGIDPKAVRHLLYDMPVAGIAGRLAKAVGISESSVHAGLLRDVGFAGSAAPLMQLAYALERAGPGEIVVLVGFGQGCDVLIFRTTENIGAPRSVSGLGEWMAKGRSTDNYLRYLTINRHLNVERGMRAEMDMKTALSTLYRERKSVYGLVGSKNPDTGTVQYPRSEIPLHSHTGRRLSGDEYPLADRPARIASFTADRLGFYIDPPGYYGMLDFEGGGRLIADFSDMQSEDATVGRVMRMAFRIKARDENRGFNRYFWKGVPQR